MKVININKYNFLQFQNIQAPHIISMRPFDLQEKTHTNNRELIADYLNAAQKHIVFPQQTHSKNIGIVYKENLYNEFAATDALITAEENVTIGVLTADCVPILLHDPIRRVVAAVHAGWRGTAQNIVSATIRQMQNTFGSIAGQIKAGIGPSISPDVYEVGQEVYNQLESTGHDVKTIFEQHKPGKYLLNLWEANIQQMTHQGISKDNIELSGLCTFQNYDKFYSARYEGIQTGRLASIIKNSNGSLQN